MEHIFIIFEALEDHDCPIWCPIWLDQTVGSRHHGDGMGKDVAVGTASPIPRQISTHRNSPQTISQGVASKCCGDQDPDHHFAVENHEISKYPPIVSHWSNIIKLYQIQVLMSDRKQNHTGYNNVFPRHVCCYCCSILRTQWFSKSTWFFPPHCICNKKI